MASLVVQEQGRKITYDLQEGQNVVGRHPDCTVSIVQPSVSGKHAIIYCQGGQFSIEDAGSRNGTFVNRYKIEQRVLINHNDMIQFGDAVARFEQGAVAPPPAAPPPQPVAAAPQTPAPQAAPPPAAAAPPPPAAAAPQPAAPQPAAPQPAAPPPAAATPPPAAAAPPAAEMPSAAGGATVDAGFVGDVEMDDDEGNVTGEAGGQGRFGGLDVNPEAKLKAVLEISNSLAGTVDLNALLPKILETLFSIFTYADRGCILLRDPATGEMVPRAMKHRREGEDATVRLSRTIVNKVLTDKVGILSADAATDANFSGSTSIADLKIRSMMCVPLLGLDGEPTGILSVDSQNPLGQFSNDDLEILLTVAGQAALSYESARLMQSYLEKQKQDNEMKIAQTVQRALLPEELPPAEGYEFFASYDSAQAVGGDYYDAFDMGDGKICLSFGDVAGKGVPGALIMSRMSSCVQSTLRHVKDVVEAISAINDHMCDSAVEGRFVTYVLVIVDTVNHTVELSNAGHMSPIIRRADGSVEQFDEELVGTPIGVLEDYPYESETKQLEPGDMIVIFTDGVDEAMNPEGELYGGDRLLEFVKNGPPSPNEMGRVLLADVRRHANGRPQNDDITIMTLGRVQ